MCCAAVSEVMGQFRTPALQKNDRGYPSPITSRTRPDAACPMNPDYAERRRGQRAHQVGYNAITHQIEIVGRPQVSWRDKHLAITELHSQTLNAKSPEVARGHDMGIPTASYPHVGIVSLAIVHIHYDILRHPIIQPFFIGIRVCNHVHETGAGRRSPALRQVH